MSRLTDRLERDLREIAAGADPSPSAWDSIVARLDEEGGSEVAFVRAPSSDRSNRRSWITSAAAAFVVVAGAIAVLTWAGDDRSNTADLPSLTSTFVSPRHGFSVDHPDEVTVTPATQFWDPGAAQPDNTGVDVIAADSTGVFTGGSMSIPEEGFPTGPWDTVDDWFDDLLSPAGCGVPRAEQAEVTIDGEPGRLSVCEGRHEATVVAGGRLYGFTLLSDRRDAREVFDALVATIDLTPETASEVPGLTATFVSPTNGFAFGYLDRGGLEPASVAWDPADVPGDDLDGHPPDFGFDVVETGLGAYFMAASTPIPNGVPLDDWIDEVVVRDLGRTCTVPRGQQAEIAIDGRSGRVLECPEEIVATVVAGGRLYQFSLLHDGRDDARAFFDAWVATIDLRPEAAAAP